jgi:hypothetical protein
MSSKYTGEKKSKFDSQYLHVPLVQSSPTECSVSECDPEEALTHRGVLRHGKDNSHCVYLRP